MRVLVVKLTSLGDVLHLMPALSDLHAQNSDVVVDWMVEDSFAEIPKWHRCVDKVIPVSTRRWRKATRANFLEFWAFFRDLRKERYDVVIDAQGLMKSAVFSRFARLHKGGIRIGFSGESIKESPAAKLYNKKINVPREQHAISRLRELLAGGFDYSVPAGSPNYGLVAKKASSRDIPTVFLFHGTTWQTKHLPDQTWRQIAELAVDDGYQVNLCWGNEQEQQRAQWIAKGLNNVIVLPRTNLSDLKSKIAKASGAIAVDTGLGHLSAALGVPCVSIYGSTDAKLTGAVGENQQQWQSSYPCSPCMLKVCPKLTQQVLAPPCYQEMTASAIWQRLYAQIV